MTLDAIITLIVILAALILFATEIVAIDLVAILILVVLTVTRVINPSEAVAGFSNNATVTVMFMFILSGALLKTGGLQYLATKFSHLFRNHFVISLVVMMAIVGFVSAFINNTPIVAVMMPIVIQMANQSNQPASKMLIPLSYATIFGGTCSLIGTSTNIIVSGIAQKSGLGGFAMFDMLPMGIIFLTVGIIYIATIGVKLLPKHDNQTDLTKQFGITEYLTEIVLLSNSASVNKQIMRAPITQDFDVEILEVQRNGNRYVLPPGDFMLRPNDLLKIKCSIATIKQLKDRVMITERPQVRIAESSFKAKDTTLVEFVITSYSEMENKTLRELDFRRKYRAAPLAIRHREIVLKDNLHDTPLKSGDVILAEVKTHFLKELKEIEFSREAPFIILSEENIQTFKPRKLLFAGLLTAAVIVLASFGIVDIMIGAIAATVLFVVSGHMKMKEVYTSINWNVIFLLAGTLSLGVAMQKSGLAANIAHLLVDWVGQWGLWALVSGVYLVTSVLTEIMSNNAAAALIAPIAIAIAASLGVSATPFLMAVAFAASASFSTPVGYQTNTMVFSAGQYKFSDFFRVGIGLNILFWILASIMLPIIYPF